ncbi:MAG: hypothetical protein KC635_16905, partial [Myxococcales bacterium]|nr:hypothetical protein [Myxococcales bacterium]
PAAEQCNGADDDCDGRTDEALTEACESECGRGLRRCVAGAFGACNAPAPQVERCDGVDNDCDGDTDEGLARPCLTACGEGAEVCRDGVWAGCDAPPVRDELCNTLDDDCDGDVDTVDASGDLPTGAFCVTNSQCASTYCIDSPTGGYCTNSCIDGCPEGWLCRTVGGITDPVELCVNDLNRLCEPCENDSQCGSAGLNRCLAIGGGHFCGRDCQSDPCPTGYACEELELDGQSLAQCIPANATCDCTEDSAGLVKACNVTNDFGTCFGTATCDPELGYVGCTAPTPADDVCDGLDNDCDGQTDEGQSPAECERSNDAGICTGIETCQGVAGRVCSAQEPGAEACNGFDDDCDGETDEDFKNASGVIATTENCGACGLDCNLRFDHAAEVTCDSSGGEPACKIVACEAGYVAFGDTTCLSENATLCNPCVSDADCFGDGSRCLQMSATDPRTFCARDCSGGSGFSTTCPASYTCDDVAGEQQCRPVTASCDCTQANAGQVKACTRTNAIGTCFGTETCDPASGWAGCTAPEPAVETCNGNDDDCDGFIDEEVGAGAACETTNALGTCTGVTVCSGAAGLRCNAPTPAEETCNGVDDDCDGETDEGFATSVGGALKYGLSVDNCGACGRVCPTVPHGTVTCDASGAVPRCAVASCEPGYYAHLGTTCLPVPTTNSCAQCSTAADCQGPNDRCVAEGGAGSYCARDCAAGSIYGTAATACSGATGVQSCCPAGYTCESVGGGALGCRPASGSCRCLVDGGVTACSVTNGFGTCLGTQVCELDPPTPGLGACSARTPAVETCDGVDNDCDGQVDAADTSLATSTTPNGQASCANGPGCPGTWSCVNAGWQCSAQ